MQHNDPKNKKFPAKRNNETSPMIYGKMPPQSTDLEGAVLGAMMLEPSSLDIVFPILQIDDFYSDANSRIYNAMATLFLAGRTKLDFMIVCEQLRQTNELEFVGGSYYVTSLTRDVVSSANIEEHARIVKQMSIMRGIIKICGVAIGDAYEATTDCFDLITKVQLQFAEMESGIRSQSVVHIGAAMMKTIDDMSVAAKNDSDFAGMRTGFSAFDNITSGLCSPDMIIIAGGAGEGKSTFAFQIAKQMSAMYNEPGLFVSLEMKNKQMMWKSLSADLKIDVKTIRRGKLNPNQWETAIGSTADYKKTPLYLYDQGGLSIYELRSIARSMKAKHQIKFVVVDYLQLLTTDGGTRNFGIREQEVNFISKQLKEMAMELDIVVIPLSQLNRLEKGAKRTYRLDDLRESGAIGQDADGVIFIWRPSYHGVTSYKLDNHSETIFADDDVVPIIAKWRLGETGYFRMKFVGYANKFEPWIPPTYEQPAKIERPATVPAMQLEIGHVVKTTDDDVPF